jgi:hypothetical protein
MDSQPQDLDNYITGHYGEDQYRDNCPDREEGTMSALETLVREYGLSENDAKEALQAIGYSQLLEALRPLAALGLWDDNYPPDSDEYAEARASNSRLEVWVRPSQVRAARAAIKATGG